VRRQKLKVHDEIKGVYQQQLRDSQNLQPSPDVAALIQERLTEIAESKMLSQCEVDARAEFHDVFELIPHVSELPNDMVARIKLKDANKTIASQSYSCPCKYHKAWCTLIQQHLDAG
jgi:hypothetical protein